MEAKIAALWPEISLFLTACVVMVMGLSRSAAVRQATDILVYIGLAVAFFLAMKTTPEVAVGILPGLALYGKMLVCVVGILLYMLLDGVADRDYEASVARGRSVFDPLRSIRGEFASFFLFSLTGLMLCTGADDLIWLFLALELTSLPTYVMVALSTPRERSLEASVKYFFLGALGAAVFLYGFALIYGGTGSTNFVTIRNVIAEGGLNTLTLVGMIVAILGICFKIAAVPMHFYTPDVYEGAAASVSGMLAFVPKSAGFFAIMLLTGCVGWTYGEAGVGGLPEALRWVLIIVAVLTMTVGNILALHQRSLKRLLAYSSIAHSGYMLVGIIAGPGRPGDIGLGRNGLGAVLFYLACYGIMSVGTFAVAATLERERKASRDTIDDEAADGVSREEVDDLADLRGLCSTRPLLGWTLVITSMGLLGLPPLLGFVGKLPLFTSAIAAGEVVLVIILGLNSAIAAWYYLGLAKTALLEKPEPVPGERVVEAPFPARKAAGVMAAVGVVVLALVGRQLASAAEEGGRYWVDRDQAGADGAEHVEHAEQTPANAQPDAHVDARRVR